MGESDCGDVVVFAMVMIGDGSDNVLQQKPRDGEREACLLAAACEADDQFGHHVGLVDPAY